jgi:hypothetical protein
MKIEINLSDHYRKDLIELLTRFSKFNNDKNFKNITRSDIIAFWILKEKTEASACNGLTTLGQDTLRKS